MSGGGEINLTNDSASVTGTIGGLPDLSITKTHTGSFTSATPAIYSIVVSNVGGVSTSATATVTDPLPAGLTPVSANGAGWTCSTAAQTVTCTRNDALTAGSSYAPIHITVQVAAALSGSIVNTATVSGGGESNTSNDKAQDTAAITAMPDLTITKTHSGTGARGGPISYALTVSDLAAAPTDGTLVTVTDPLPAGITPVSATGAGWTCSIAAQSVSCMRHDVLAGQSSYPAITIAATLALTAPAIIVNTATASGGGDATPGNDQAQDTLTIAANPDLTVTAKQNGTFHKRSAGTFTLTVSDVGQAATDGTPVTVIDTLPPGLVPVSASGTGWTCSIAGQSVTCRRSDILNTGAAYPDISVAVNVAPDAPANITTNISVSNARDTDQANNTAALQTPIAAALLPDLTVALSHGGDFMQGGTAQYSVQVSNIGEAPTAGLVSVCGTLPAGFLPSSASGNGWTCTTNGANWRCTRADSLVSAGKYPPIALTVKIASDSPLELASTATVGGGGEQNLANDSASDQARIVLPPLPQLAITITADRSEVEAGDVILYTVQITNTSATAAEDTVGDTLPPAGIVYAPGTARAQTGVGAFNAVAPAILGSDLSFKLGYLAPHGTITITYRARVGVSARTGTFTDVARANAFAPTGQHIGPVMAQVSVKVGSSLLNAQRSLVGRVFVDRDGNNQFEKGDIPVPGVRVFLSDGQAAVTDSQGLYSLPTVPQGSIVVSIDPTTMPNGYALSDEGEHQGRSFTRLLRTPLGSGSLLRQNFALRALPDTKPADTVVGSLAPQVLWQDHSSKTEAQTANKPEAHGNPVRRIEILAGKREISAGGRDFTKLTIRAFDDGGKPVDASVNLSTSSGYFRSPGSPERGADPAIIADDRVTQLDFQNIGAGAGNGGASVAGTGMGSGASLGAGTSSKQPVTNRDLLRAASPQNQNQAPETGSNQQLLTLHDGEATVVLASALQPGSAQIVATADTAAIGMGESNKQVQSRLDLAFVPELRAPILVGLGELSFGRGAPEMALFDEAGHIERRAQLFYSGKLAGTNLLTLAYSSQSRSIAPAATTGCSTWTRQTSSTSSLAIRPSASIMRNRTAAFTRESTTASRI